MFESYLFEEYELDVWKPSDGKGFVAYRIESGECYINHLFREKEHRGKMQGFKMIKEFEQFLIEATPATHVTGIVDLAHGIERSSRKIKLFILWGAQVVEAVNNRLVVRYDIIKET